MKTEFFTIAGSSEILKLVERAGSKAGVARGQGFGDFLTLLRCELAGKTMEKQYLVTVGKGNENPRAASRKVIIQLRSS